MVYRASNAAKPEQWRETVLVEAIGALLAGHPAWQIRVTNESATQCHCRRTPLPGNCFCFHTKPLKLPIIDICHGASIPIESTPS